MPKAKTKQKKTAIKNELDVLLETAKENFEKDGGLTPVLFIDCDKDGKSGRIIAPLITNDWDSFRERRFDIMCKLGEEIDKKGYVVQKLIFLSESYVLKSDKTEMASTEDVERYYKEHGSIAGHPNTREAVMVSSWNTKDNKKEIVAVPYIKDKTGKIVFDKEKMDLSNTVKNQDARFYLLESFLKGYLSN